MNFNDNSAIRPVSSKGSYREDTADAKPSGKSSSGGKDFRKIYEKDESDDEQRKTVDEDPNDLPKETSPLGEANRKKPIASLFSLAGTATNKTQERAGQGDGAETTVVEHNEKNKLHSPSDVYASMNQSTATDKRATLSKAGQDAPLLSENSEGQMNLTPASEKEVLKTVKPAQQDALNPYDRLVEDEGIGEDKKIKVTPTSYLQDQPDLSYINPLSAATQTVATTPVQESAPPVSVSHLQEIIDQIVKKLYTVSKDGQVDTVVEIKNIPAFEKVTVRVSSFESAPGQYNIAFEHLSQEAKNMLDINRADLLEQLERKGYMVHIFTTSPGEAENPLMPEQKEGFAQNDQREEQREQQGRHNQGRNR